MPDDAELLRQFVHEQTEASFSELVRRHIDLVYGAAMRRTGGDVHRAADISQEVFTRLAHNAAKLTWHPALAAWLHTATRNCALNVMISEQRRIQRETEAVRIADTGADAPDWEKVRPVLDEAIDHLRAKDRGAVVLRFLDRKSFAQIGANLKVSEDAARMRVERALGKLRIELERRGIPSTAAALAVVVSTHATVAAPTTLAAQIAPVATRALSLGLANSAALSMSTKAILAGSAAAVAAFFAGDWYGSHHAPKITPPPIARSNSAQTDVDLRHENERLKAELAAMRIPATPEPQIQSVEVPSARAASAGTTAQQQRQILNNLRQIASARDMYAIEHNGTPPSSLQDLIGEGKYIRRIEPVNGEDYAYVSLGARQVMSVIARDATTVTYDPAGKVTTKVPNSATGSRSQPDLDAIANALGIDPGSLHQAWNAYLTAHANAQPKNPNDLLPYFATAKEGADFAEAIAAKNGKPAPPEVAAHR